MFLNCVNINNNVNQGGKSKKKQLNYCVKFLLKKFTKTRGLRESLELRFKGKLRAVNAVAKVNINSTIPRLLKLKS